MLEIHFRVAINSQMSRIEAVSNLIEERLLAYEALSTGFQLSELALNPETRQTIPSRIKPLHPLAKFPLQIVLGIETSLFNILWLIAYHKKYPAR